MSELPTLQYGVWLRGEVPRRGDGDLIKFGTEEGWYAKGGPMRDAMGGGGCGKKRPYTCRGRIWGREKSQIHLRHAWELVTEGIRLQREVRKAESKRGIMKKERRPASVSNLMESLPIWMKKTGKGSGLKNKRWK